MQRKILVTSIVLASAIGAAPALFAQDGARAIEEIIITARRVEESAQDVPLAVTAFGEKQLEQAGIVDVGDLAKSVPSFNAVPTTGRKSATTFMIRGQKPSDVLITVDPAVGVYVAEVPIVRTYGLGTASALDIQTLQVLKGPQGTLFGRNNTGGAVVITPNEPTEDLEGSIKGGLGNYNQRTLEGIANLPLTDTLAARFAVASNSHDGYIENRNPGGDDFGDENTLTWRATVKWQPTDVLTSTFFFDGFDSHDNGTAVASTYASPNGALAGVFGPAVTAQQGAKFYSSSGDDGVPGRSPSGDVQVLGASNTTTYDINDTLTLKNVLGWRSVAQHDITDLDGARSPAPVVRLGLSTDQRSNIDQYSEELQLIATYDKLDLIGGLFWFKEEGTDGAYAEQFGSSSISGGEAENISYSAFTQGSYHLTDDLNITLGLRWSHDDRSYTANAQDIVGGNQLCAIYTDNTGATRLNPTGPCHPKADDSSEEPTYNLSLDYKLADRQMVYGAVRHGYRSGAFSSRAATIDNLVAAEPETVDDYELGYKGDFDIGSTLMRLNAAVYYSDYSEMQRLRTRLTNSGKLYNTIENAGSATIQGAELEATWSITDDLTVTGFYSYIDAQYDEWEGANAAGQSADLSDNKFNGVPLNSGSLTVRYRLPFIDVAVGDVFVQANAYHQSQVALFDTQELPGSTQDSYWLYNARIDWENVLGQPLDISLWGKNLADEEYYVGALVIPQLGFSTGYFGDPRTFGVEAKYKF
ncbi:MAG: TonB-dependent receptor [Spongiibacteraceae bacterium]